MLRRGLPFRPAVAASPDVLLLQAVARALMAWDSIETGAERLLGQIAGAVGLPAAALWLVGKEGFEPRATWVSANVDGSAFRRDLVGPDDRLGADLAQLASERAEPLLAGVGPGSAAGRSRFGDTPALRAAIAVPAQTGSETLGVVILYGTDLSDPQTPSLEALGAASHLLGELIERWRFQEVHAKLTRRELELLTLASRGLTTGKIAAQLSLSPWTVKTHFEHIRLKLEVSDRTAAVAHALRTGMIV
jgi:DNA-binding CsgD family transcriptional regulator